MKVLVYTNTRWIGGVLTFTQVLGKECADDGCDDVSYVFATDKNNKIKELYPKRTVLLNVKTSGIEYDKTYGCFLARKVAHFLPRLVYEMGKPFVRFKNRRIIREYLIQNNFDCVIGNSGGYVNSIIVDVLKEAKKINIPERIFLSHNYPLSDDKDCFYDLKMKHADKQIRMCSTNIVTVSQYCAKRIECISKRHYPKIDVIYNGIDIAKTQNSKEQNRDRLGLNVESYVIGMVANFIPYKGQLYFLKVAKEIKKRTGKDIEFVIIGGIVHEEYYSMCMEYSNDNHLSECLHVYTGIGNAADYMSAFDILLAPTLDVESFGLASSEAMIRGVPVVAFDTGGLSEVVQTDRTGFVVPCKDIEAMAECVIELIENRNKYDLFSENAKKFAQTNFSGYAMRRNYAKYIKNHFPTID